MPTSLSRVPSPTRGCAPWRPAAVVGTVPPGSGGWLFKGVRAWSDAVALFRPLTSFSARSDSGDRKGVSKTRNLLPPRPPASPALHASPPVNAGGAAGVLTSYPFGAALARSRLLGRPLGPSNPRPHAVVAEPFSTSVFRGTGIAATPTEICTGERSRRPYGRPSTRTPRPPTPRVCAGQA